MANIRAIDDGEPSKTARWLNLVGQELGLSTILKSPVDTKILCLQRFVRLFAYGSANLIFTLLLHALDISDQKIGLFMTLTLFGDVFISFILTLFADGLGRRRVLALGAALMTVSGIVFSLSGNYWVLLAAAIFGVISPSGNEIGPFRAIEESTLAHLTESRHRTDVFAWYTLIGVSGAALGTIFCGWFVEHLQHLKGWDNIRAYRVVYTLYAALGIFKFVLACLLSKKCEAEPEVKPQDPSESSEETPLLPNKPKENKSILPKIGKESLSILIKLGLLFALDSLASGLVPSSWIIYFFNQKFHVSDGTLGTIFFVTNFVSAASTLVASSVSRRIGPIKTMVFTHLPSSVFLGLIPIPTTLPFALVFLILRHSLASMDVAPRQAFLSSVVLPSERTAVMGVINVVKTLSQSLGPVVTGALAGANKFWVAFVLAGTMKVSYDLGILAAFASHKPQEERAEEAAHEREGHRDEEEEGAVAADRRG